MSVDVQSDAARRPGQDGDVLVRLTGLKKYFPITRGIVFQKHVGDVRAVDGIDLEIRRGETLEIGRAHV